ncbi:MAG TPA: SPOR domain-containing protein [Steroidobacteraceae bacterium]|jgi:hypothetical protein|nr:SPOR domain-containing protein [Steroidobacteraceae bacterium]
MQAGIGDRRGGGIGLALGVGLALGMLLLAGCSHESADWKQATLANSTEAYQAFLQQHPRSPEAAQAQTRIKELTAQRDWQIASAADTRDAYQQFVTAHPDSKWVQEAKIRIENFAQAGVSGGAALASTGSATAAGAAGTAAAVPAASATTAAPPSGPAAALSAPAAGAAGKTAHLASTRSAHPHAHARTHTAAARTGTAAAGRVVQLGAFRSRARAESEWKMLSVRFQALRTLTPHYVAAPSRSGHVYRLQVHLSSPAAASGLCATLKRHARPCLRVST